MLLSCAVVLIRQSIHVPTFTQHPLVAVSPLQDVKASTLMDLELADYQHTVHSLEATVADKEQELQDAWLAKEKQGTVVEELRKQLSTCRL